MEENVHTKPNLISLQDVVSVTNQPITEEHAWAILYQGITKLREVSYGQCYLLEGLQDLLLTVDGRVHTDSFTISLTGGQRTPMNSFSTGIAELGVVVYNALDWQVPDGMSRELSAELDQLLDMMVSADDQEQEDEGISIGEEEMFSSLCRKISQACRRHHSPVINLKQTNKVISFFPSSRSSPKTRGNTTAESAKS